MTQATHYRPGSADKVGVLISRAERGEPLYHPDDHVCPIWHGILKLLERIHRQPLAPIGDCEMCGDGPMRIAFTGERWLCRECWANSVLGMYTRQRVRRGR